MPDKRGLATVINIPAAASVKLSPHAQAWIGLYATVHGETLEQSLDRLVDEGLRDFHQDRYPASGPDDNPSDAADKQEAADDRP